MSPEGWQERRSEKQLQRLIDHTLREHYGFRSLRKNGDTWREWLERALTPERVLMIVLLIFTFGRDVQRFDSDLEEQQRRTNVMQKQHEDINQSLNDLVAWRRIEVSQTHDAQTEIARVRQLAETAIKQNAAIQEQMRAQPTRGEFNKLAERIAGLVQK